MEVGSKIQQGRKCHCLVSYDHGEGDFSAQLMVLISSYEKNIYDAIKEYFEKYWGDIETEQTEDGGKFRWFEKAGAQYVKINTMNMIENPLDAEVLGRFINTYEPPIICWISGDWDDLSMFNVAEFTNMLRNNYPETKFYFYDVSNNERQVGLVASNYQMDEDQAQAFYAEKLREEEVEIDMDDFPDEPGGEGNESDSEDTQLG